MKLEEIKRTLEKIESISGDDEMAHSLEDDLFYDFVDDIASDEFKSKEDIIEAAKEVYKVKTIEFCRWHA